MPQYSYPPPPPPLVSPRTSLAPYLPYTPARPFLTPESYDTDDPWLKRKGQPSSYASTDTMVDADDLERDRYGSPRKKPRITLPRGHACVACSKCQEGIRPCATCVKANLDCKDEEIPRKKPRNVLLEERIHELESMLGIRKSSSARPSISASNFSGYSTDSGPSSDPYIAGEPLHSGPSRISTPYTSAQPRTMPPPLSSASPHMDLDIIPGSSIELALIQYILPYTPHLLIPVHPERLLSELSLAGHDPSRPHPALLYVLFSEAVRHLEAGIPPTSLPTPPYLFPPSLTPPIPAPSLPPDALLNHLAGTAPLLLERARHELEVGMRQVDRVFDLARAAVGIARGLYVQGSVWASSDIRRVHSPPPPPPHPQPSTTPPTQSQKHLPPPYAPEQDYPHAHTYNRPSIGQPPLRMKAVLIPPARDEIEVAERVMTFWAAKRQLWTMSVGWGWPDMVPDGECTTEWPWGWGHVEAGVMSERYSSTDLFDPSSAMHTSAQIDTTYTLATKSTALLARASSLSDLPHSQRPVALQDGTVVSTYVAPIGNVKEVQTALALFRQHLPGAFNFPPSVSSGHAVGGHSPKPIPTHANSLHLNGHSHSHPHPHSHSQNTTTTPAQGQVYDGPADPFWILLHINLYTAEMLMWWEMANHQGVGAEAHRSAVQCARAVVGLVAVVPDDKWANVDMLCALSISYATRVLYKEASLCRSTGAVDRADRATADALVLRRCLEGPFRHYSKVAGLFAKVVDRINLGQSEKVGEYERV
ncbi:hypothetical protein IAR50_000468 [Cryptococcus sp. DSM 104548]